MKSSHTFMNRLIWSISGVITAFKSEQNVRIHMGLMVLALFFCYTLSLTYLECSLVFLCIGIVICCELLNTSIELLATKCSPTFDQTIKKVKDIAAGAVLIASLTALAVGSCIFLPKLLIIIKGLTKQL